MLLVLLNMDLGVFVIVPLWSKVYLIIAIVYIDLPNLLVISLGNHSFRYSFSTVIESIVMNNEIFE